MTPSSDGTRWRNSRRWCTQRLGDLLHRQFPCRAATGRRRRASLTPALRCRAAVLLESPVQRPAVHAKHGRHVLHRNSPTGQLACAGCGAGLSGSRRRPQPVAPALGPRSVRRVERVHRRQGTVEPVTFENDSGLVAVEAQWRAEEPLAWPQVRGRAAGNRNHRGQPVGPAQVLQDVERDCHRAQLRCALCRSCRARRWRTRDAYSRRTRSG